MGDADIIELGIIDPAAPRPGSHAATDSRNSGKAPPLKVCISLSLAQHSR